MVKESSVKPQKRARETPSSPSIRYFFPLFSSLPNTQIYKYRDWDTHSLTHSLWSITDRRRVMANPQKAWKAEYAKSARSSCKTCKSIIDKEILRLGKMVQAKQFDGFMPVFFPPFSSLFHYPTVFSFSFLHFATLSFFWQKKGVKKCQFTGLACFPRPSLHCSVFCRGLGLYVEA